MKDYECFLQKSLLSRSLMDLFVAENVLTLLVIDTLAAIRASDQNRNRTDNKVFYYNLH